MPAVKKYKGMKIVRLSGDVETVINVLQGGYKTDAGGPMVKHNKVSFNAKRNKLIEHEDRVNPDGTPFESKRGRKKQATEKTGITRTKKEKKQRNRREQEETSRKKKKKKVKRLPVEETVNTKKKKKLQLEVFTNKYVKTELMQLLVSSIAKGLEDCEYDLKLRKHVDCAYNNNPDTGGPEARYYIDIVPTNNNRVRHVPEQVAIKPQIKREPEKRLKLKTLIPEELAVGAEEALSKYEKTFDRVVPKIGEKRGPKVAKTLATFEVGKYFVNTETKELCMLLGYNKEWKSFVYAIVISPELKRKQGTIDGIKTIPLVNKCEAYTTKEAKAYYDQVYSTKYTEQEKDFEETGRKEKKRKTQEDLAD